MPAKRSDVYVQKSFNCSKPALDAISEIKGLAHRAGFPTITYQGDAIEVAVRELAAQLRKKIYESQDINFQTINEY